ncbi:YKOF-related Family protein [Sporotomaculum syntrophicum]|uniref:YKOF-related Family protein n=1 Tax=Sporotomaculum syntrophicum TaxID=182264 RepID=A0A9D3AVG0_9FIRM|nr:YkoF family thiamine/hydroxymethylpyrimidine-binding protein [Sporotomaculum syntrophicum]KAF1084055.1 YKOF-related Family protein [Sporotomaculum syntrophicum]
MLTAEVSLYPQKTTSASQIINNSIDTLRQYDLQTQVGSMSTRLQGTDQEVWAGLQSLFYKASNQSEVNMVVTISNSAF